MYYDCDHLKAADKIYTIRGNWAESENVVLAKPVYELNHETNTYTKIVDRKGNFGETLVWLNPKKYEHIRCRGIDIKDYQGIDIWSRIIKEIIKLGISPEDIGLFGSKRLGFPNYRDEDFVIYGKKNMCILHENIFAFKESVGLYNQTYMHAKHQADVHGKYYDRHVNSLILCLIRKWSTCAFSPEQATTIRFVPETVITGNILKKHFFKLPMDEICTIRGVVTDDEGTSFMPRFFKIRTNFGIFTVITPLWIFHQCVRKNDLVEVTGVVSGDKLLVWRYSHGIKIL